MSICKFCKKESDDFYAIKSKICKNCYKRQIPRNWLSKRDPIPLEFSSGCGPQKMLGSKKEPYFESENDVNFDHSISIEDLGESELNFYLNYNIHGNRIV